MKMKRLMRAVRNHVWGPVGSMAFHAAVVLMLLAWAGKSKVPPVILESEFVQIDPKKTAPMELEKPIELPPVKSFDALAPLEDVPAVQASFDEPAEVATTTAEANAQPAGAPGLDASFERSPAALELSELKLSGTLGWRIAQKGDRDAGPKVSSAQNPKGNSEAEACIRRALLWLKANQAEDGSWGPNKVAMTGLALLTFLGNGETSGSKEFGATVRRAIDWLAAHQRVDGIFAVGKGVSQPTVYEHGIATYAMSEAYGMTRRPDLLPMVEKAAAVIVNGQQPGGLWDYEYKKSARWDTSVSGWQVQALKAAFVNGAEVSGLAEALVRSVAGMKGAQGDGGTFGYSQPGLGKIGMTGVGVLCLELAGQGGTQPMRAGSLALRGVECDWQKPAAWPLYTWYYVTQALYHEQGAAWDPWSRKLLRELARNQNADGSWNSPTGSAYENEESKHGPVYSTTLATLALCANKRYAPVSQSLHSERQSRPKPARDEVTVEII